LALENLRRRCWKKKILKVVKKFTYINLIYEGNLHWQIAPMSISCLLFGTLFTLWLVDVVPSNLIFFYLYVDLFNAIMTYTYYLLFLLFFNNEVCLQVFLLILCSGFRIVHLYLIIHLMYIK
jgi:hypothetical protein